MGRRFMTAMAIAVLAVSAFAGAALAGPDPQALHDTGQQGAGCYGLASAIINQKEQTGEVNTDLFTKYLDRGCPAPGAPNQQSTGPDGTLLGPGIWICLYDERGCVRIYKPSNA